MEESSDDNIPGADHVPWIIRWPRKPIQNIQYNSKSTIFIILMDFLQLQAFCRTLTHSVQLWRAAWADSRVPFILYGHTSWSQSAVEYQK